MNPEDIFMQLQSIVQQSLLSESVIKEIPFNQLIKFGTEERAVFLVSNPR